MGNGTSYKNYNLLCHQERIRFSCFKCQGIWGRFITEVWYVVDDEARIWLVFLSPYYQKYSTFDDLNRKLQGCSFKSLFFFDDGYLFIYTCG